MIFNLNVLLVGSGGREHALAWKITQSHLIENLFIAPGNAGTRHLGTNVDIPYADINSLAKFAKEHLIDLTIVGPEEPLANGLVDRFSVEGLKAFGPTAKAAQLESSKTFAKEFMNEFGIPTAMFSSVETINQARKEVQKLGLPVVIKADGLAAGKGVYICQNMNDVEKSLSDLFVDRKFGESGNKVLIEEFMIGPEISVFAFTDGETISPLIAACDHKRIGEGDTGPNTGGMGAFSPSPLWNTTLIKEIEQTIMNPVISGMRDRGTKYVGVLFAGIMITQEGPKVLEFNCRLGDPETQTILPLMITDILEACKACTEGTLNDVSFKWADESCVSVVLTSGGYPSSYETGVPILGLETVDSDVNVFHAGTKISQETNCIETNGGRVIAVAAKGQTIEIAKKKVYSNIDLISFSNSYYRRDIASKEKIESYKS